MNISDRILAKIDSHLAEFLLNARGVETLTAILSLCSVDANKPAGLDRLHPSDFGSREAYRRALIAQKQTDFQKAYGETLETLKLLELNPSGGRTSRTVVVRGTAKSLLSALQLPTISHASLDRPIQMIMRAGLQYPIRRGLGNAAEEEFACNLHCQA